MTSKLYVHSQSFDIDKYLTFLRSHSTRDFLLGWNATKVVKALLVLQTRSLATDATNQSFSQKSLIYTHTYIDTIA